MSYLKVIHILKVLSHCVKHWVLIKSNLLIDNTHCSRLEKIFFLGYVNLGFIEKRPQIQL